MWTFFVKQASIDCNTIEFSLFNNEDVGGSNKEKISFTTVNHLMKAMETVEMCLWYTHKDKIELPKEKNVEWF